MCDVAQPSVITFTKISENCVLPSLSNPDRGGSKLFKKSVLYIPQDHGLQIRIQI
jgi:hypothetical protein